MLDMRRDAPHPDDLTHARFMQRKSYRAAHAARSRRYDLGDDGDGPEGRQRPVIRWIARMNVWTAITVTARSMAVSAVTPATRPSHCKLLMS